VLAESSYCDDTALVAGTAEGADKLMQMYGEFMYWHAMEINLSKTVYVTNAANPKNIAVPCWDLGVEGGGDEMRILEPRPPDTPFKYLGVWLSVDLDWTVLSKLMYNKMMGIINHLRGRAIGSAELSMLLSTVVKGSFGYFVQATRLTTTQLMKLDAALAKAIRAKNKLPRSSMRAIFTASTAGMGGA
jgi:hypothetical protein